MHGIGNDYIYINCFEQTIANPEELSIRLSDRHFGIGSDGVILILPSDVADCRMRMFNADGSEGKMCGNGIRCVGKYVYDNKLVRKDIITVETLSGIKTLKLFIENGQVASVEVNMGAPILESRLIPVLVDEDDFIDKEMDVAGKTYRVTCVSMGNPHAVIFTSGIDDLKLFEIGPMFEHNALFPERINTEFVEVIDEFTLKMRVWERGSGETLACGTGACATVVAAILNGISKKEEDILVKLTGGDLLIRWEKDGFVYMKGSATHVFDTVVEI
jgi:diaminopimelate epimerase